MEYFNPQELREKLENYYLKGEKTVNQPAVGQQPVEAQKEIVQWLDTIDVEVKGLADLCGKVDTTFAAVLRSSVPEESEASDKAALQTGLGERLYNIYVDVRVANDYLRNILRRSELG